MKKTNSLDALLKRFETEREKRLHPDKIIKPTKLFTMNSK